MSKKFGYDEIVDTFNDLIEAVAVFTEAFEGGFNFSKFLFAAAQEYGTIKEAFEDAGTFWTELKDLTPEESLNAVAEIKSNFDDPTPIQAKAIEIIENLALTQDYIQGSVIGGGASPLST